ncbi:MAG TPA: DUF3108 domain-containing protein, partial [Candidatus Synoicihabitans sp.]|nr:DUF3108 domain-containing protein [Candidatus Synoicihabitans sp.]
MNASPLTRLFPLLLGLTPAAGAAPLQDGERFVYRVAWGLFGNAGTITVEADDEYLEGLRQTRITTQTSTRGFVRALYPFDGHVESVFDYRSGQLLAATARTTSKRRNTQAAIAFDYSTGLARYVDSFRPDRSTWVEIPEGSPMDLITSLINTRGWNLEVGEKRPVVVLFDDEFYDLVVTAERIETIDTPRGEREALL